MSQYPPPPQDPNYYPPMQESDRSASGLAIGSLVCGIIGICFTPLAIVALVLGIIALGKHRSGAPGKGMAIAGVTLGSVGMVVSILAMIAILLPALGAARRTAQRMQNSTQLRGIHQGMLTYANSNKNYYPGLNSKGQILADGIDTGNSGDGNTPQARYWILLDGQFFTPEYAISPGETDALFSYSGSGAVQSDNYSYAMLDFKKTGQAIAIGSSSVYSIDPSSSGRAAEWKQTMNPNAIILSDRNTGTNTTSSVQSVWTDRPGDWKGSVLWNDNHINFEASPIFQTRYGNGQQQTADNLFEEDGDPGFNALMVYDRP